MQLGVRQDVLSDKLRRGSVDVIHVIVYLLNHQGTLQRPLGVFSGYDSQGTIISGGGGGVSWSPGGGLLVLRDRRHHLHGRDAHPLCGEYNTIRYDTVRSDQIR